MKKLFTLVVLATMMFSRSFSQTCDTLFNLQSVNDTPTYYIVTAQSQSGYVSGNNSYGDLAKAEGFQGIVGDSVYSALLYFAIAVINPASADSNSTVTINVWDNTGTSFYHIPGSPGNIIGSANVTLGQIAASISSQSEALLVNFSTPVALSTDTFYVGVVLPTTLGDTVVLYTNEVPPGPDGNGWEYESDDTWSSYNDDWGFTNGSLGNYIEVNICGSRTTGIHTISDATEAIKVFPNPANDVLNVQWDVANTEADVVMYNVTGSIVKSFTMQTATLNSFDIHDLASGAYIVRVTDRQTNEQHSTLFTKL